MDSEQHLREVRERFDQQRDPIGLYSCIRLRLPTAEADLNAGWGEFLGETIAPFGFHVLREPPVIEACFFGDQALLPRFQSLAADAQQVCPAFFVDFATASYNFCDAHRNWLFALHRLGWTHWAEMQTDFLGQADRVDDSLDEAAADLFFLINQQPSRHVDIIADWLQNLQRRGIDQPRFVYQRLGRDLFAASVTALDYVLDHLVHPSDVVGVADLVRTETSSPGDHQVTDDSRRNDEAESRYLGIRFNELSGRLQRDDHEHEVCLTRTQSKIFAAILRENGGVCVTDRLVSHCTSRKSLYSHVSKINKRLMRLRLAITPERALGYRLENS